MCELLGLLNAQLASLSFYVALPFLLFFDLHGFFAFLRNRPMPFHAEHQRFGTGGVAGKKGEIRCCGPTRSSYRSRSSKVRSCRHGNGLRIQNLDMLRL